MQRTAVESNHVHSVGYDPEKRELHVAFKNRDGVISTEGHYSDVSPERHTEMMEADSIGSFLHTQIKPNHEWTKHELE